MVRGRCGKARGELGEWAGHIGAPLRAAAFIRTCATAAHHEFDPLRHMLQPCRMENAPYTQSATLRWYPRFHLDVDWFVKSRHASAKGRSLELSARAAMLPVTCKSPLCGKVTLHIALPMRERMFQAQCEASYYSQRGWLLRYVEMIPEDFQLLGHTLLLGLGSAALPAFARHTPEELTLKATPVGYCSACRRLDCVLHKS